MGVAVTQEQTGKVYLVGAGPGDPKLLTLRAVELLEAAEVVIYDRLIQDGVLAYANPRAERIYMGKPLGKHDSRQDEINELLVRTAREGKVVVRLKGGDPFVFARGAEEAEYLVDHGIPFEVVPGISSAFAAPLSAGIPVTHRNAASSLGIITGHECKEDQSRLDWAAISKLDTLVFVMCVSNVGRITGKLIENGRCAETPAALIQMAYWPGHRVLTGTLGTIAGEAVRCGIQPPATLVVGEVVHMHDKLHGLLP